MADNLPKLGYEYVVDDQASGPMGAIEKSYVSMTKGMDKGSKKLSKSMYAQSDAMEDVGEAAEGAGEKQGKTTGKLGEAGGALKDNILGLERLGISWSKFVKFLGAASVGAALVGVVMFLKKAYDKAVEFRSEIAKLNEAYSMSAKDSRIVSGAVLGLTKVFGRTREEVLGMTRSMLEIGLVPSKVKALGGTFKSMSKDILAFSSATGVSTGAAVGFADQLVTINRLSPQSIRGIGNAIKTVADNSRMSTDELIQFNKGLEPLFAELSDGSKKSRKDFTANMIGLAGSLSNMGIDASKTPSNLADMLNNSSASGREALGKLSLFTGETGDRLQEMIRSDPSKVFDAVGKAAARMPIDQLKHLGPALSPLGMDYVDLRKIQNTQKEFGNIAKMRKDLSKFGLSEIQIQTRLTKKFGSTATSHAASAAAALKASVDQKALDKKAARRLARSEVLGNRLSKMWERIMIKIGGIVAKKVIPVLEKKLMPLLIKLGEWVETYDWEGFFTGIEEGIKTIISYVTENWEEIKKWGKYLGIAWLTLKVGLPVLNTVLNMSRSVGDALGLARSGVSKLPNVVGTFKKSARGIRTAGLFLATGFKRLAVSAMSAMMSLKGKAGMIGGALAAGAAGFALGTLLRKQFPIIDEFTEGLFNSTAELLGLSHSLGNVELAANGLEKALDQTADANRRLGDMAGFATGKFKKGSLEWGRAAFMLRDATEDDLNAWAKKVSEQTNISSDAAMAKLTELKAANVSGSRLKKLKDRLEGRKSVATVVRKPAPIASSRNSTVDTTAALSGFPEMPSSMNMPSVEIELSTQTGLMREANRLLRLLGGTNDSRQAHLQRNAGNL